MKTIKGDLINLALNGEFDVIVHGANCFQTMGSGIAVQIKKNFPQAYQADLNREDKPTERLGDISYAACKNRRGDVLYVVNAYTQFRYGLDKCHADLRAIRSSLSKVAAEFAGLRIGYPMIGAGRAGGDWSQITQIIDEVFASQDHTFVIWS